MPSCSTVALAATILCAAVAQAQKPDPSEIERGKAHYQAGASYFAEARYEDALREFNEAYRLSKRPPLLFNISLCQERVGRLDDAVASLERYLKEDPAISDRSVVEARLHNLREQKVRADAAKEPAPPPAPAPPPVEPARPRRRLFTWIAGALGVAAFAGVLAAQLVAKNDRDQLQSMCDAQGNCGFASAQSLIDGGRAAVYASYALIAVGTAALATGVVLFFVEGRAPAQAHASLAPWLAPGGGGLALDARF